MMGSRSRPLSVSWYSTRGGTSANVWRSTTPSSSSARSRSDNVRGLMPASERSSSQKREVPSERSRTRSRVHLPQTTSAVRHTGQVGSLATPNTLPNEVQASGGRSVPGGPPGRIRGAHAVLERGDLVALVVGQREAEDVDVLRPALVGAGLRQHADLGLVEQPAQRDL